MRGARVVVPMDDGSAVRARVDVADDAVDVSLRASSETGLAADQRVGELREALARQGLELRNFDLQSDGERHPPGAGSGPSEEGPDADGRPAGPASDAAPRESTPVAAIDPDAGPPASPYGPTEDLVPGGLLTRRF